MKLFIITLLLQSVSAFVPQAGVRFGLVSDEVRIHAHDESEHAVADALKASQTFGPGSKEARVAWDAVEEINSSDNSAAIGNKPEGNDQGNSPTKEYTELLTNLDFLVSEYGEKIEQIKSLATKVKSYEHDHPEVLEGKLADSAEKLATLARAKAEAEEFGQGSINEAVLEEEAEELCVLLDGDDIEFSCVDYMMLKLK